MTALQVDRLFEQAYIGQGQCAHSLLENGELLSYSFNDLLSDYIVK